MDERQRQARLAIPAADLFKTGLSNGIVVVLRLAKTILPAIVFVSLLQVTTLLNIIDHLCAPLMQQVGLPGEAAVAFIVGIFSSIYGGVGAMLLLPLSYKELTILSTMIVFCHAGFMESAVVVEAGASGLLIFSLRLFGAFLSAWLIHVCWI
ncbi:MAG TPA: nucleoside recognition domain-containing protein [Patescibacteria group bacterium]|nr:nucleoside recognition domain-containing protein [Patescibacteria group bacterium]